jgi:hypothetical protein
MDIGFDQESWRVRTEPQHGDGIEWHALRARLDAAYAARIALTGGEERPASARCGSFDLDSARSVAAFGNALSGVNPSALGNGKSDPAMDAGAPGTTNGGGRG